MLKGWLALTNDYMGNRHALRHSISDHVARTICMIWWAIGLLVKGHLSLKCINTSSSRLPPSVTDRQCLSANRWCAIIECQWQQTTRLLTGSAGARGLPYNTLPIYASLVKHMSSRQLTGCARKTEPFVLSAVLWHAIQKSAQPIKLREKNNLLTV